MSNSLRLGLVFCVLNSVNAYSETLQSLVAAASDSQDLTVSAAFVSGQESCNAFATGGQIPAQIPDSRVHTASISKLITAVLIFQLRNEGMLDLDDPVGLHDPLFSNSPITIRQLLMHTSGLRDRERAHGRTTAKEVTGYFTNLSRQRPRTGREPGWRYADAGFNLLGRLIEQVSGVPFADIARQRIFEPAAMHNSSFIVENPHNHPWDLAFIASSGLQSTASDLTRFGAVILSDFTAATELLLDRETLTEMTTPQIKTQWQNIEQGFGWQLARSPSGPVWRHAGGEAGFESLLTLYPDAGLVIAVLGDKKDWPRFELESQIQESLLAGNRLCTP